MTQLLINVVDISGGTHPDDKVRLWAPQHRPDGERVVSTSPVDVKLVEGKATVDVLPGPARVQIMTKGVVDSAPKRVTIPDEQSVTLRAVIEDGLEWEPEVISRVATLTSRAELAATRAENVADTFGSLEGVAVSVQAAEDAAASATSSAAAAASSATAANDSQVSAASSATAAAQSAVNAADSEWVAGEHKGAAESAAAGAALSADAAAVSAGAAASSESAAATSAGQADASARSASDAADRAENLVDTVHWQGDQLSVMGKVSPPLTGDDGATPYVGPNGTWWVGDTDTGVQAQGEKGDPGEGAGDVSWSELTPALDGKADVGHKHTVADLETTGTRSEYRYLRGDGAWAPLPYTSMSTSEMQDGTSGIDRLISSFGLKQAIGFHPPADHTHPEYALESHTHSEYATTAQVEARTPEIRVVSSPELATSPGVLYVVMGG